MKFDFKNSSNETLSGKLELPSTRPSAFALFAHCFTCSKDIIAANVISKSLTNFGIAVLRFDFTGLGNSQGDFSNSNFSSNVDDLIRACNELGERFEYPQILIGHSLGGAAVLKAAPLLESVKAVVTIGAPSDVGHVEHLFQSNIDEINNVGQAEVKLAGRKFKIKKQFIDDLNSTEILKGIRNMKKSLLVLHSPIDDTVSVDHAASIFTSAKHPKSYVSLDTADHLLMNRKDAEYAAKVIGSWLDRYIDKKINDIPKVESGKLLVRNRRKYKFTQDIYTKDHAIIADEPLSVNGDNLGFTPYELVMAGLGACTSMTMRMYADLKKIPLDDVEVLLEHKKIHADDCLSCETQTGKIDQIKKTIKFTGELTTEQRDRLYEIAEKCPVNRTLQSEINILSEHKKL